MTAFFYTLGRPLRAVAKRWGPSWLKGAVWRVEYKRGLYLHRQTTAGYRSKICDMVEQYARGGHILDLGCGDGAVAIGLRSGQFAGYIGVDISQVGLAMAARRLRVLDPHLSSKIAFHAGDICTFDPPHKLDVILFKDSLYYVNRLEILDVLRSYQKNLKSGGVFIVQMDNVARHGWIRELVRKNFQMISDTEETQPSNMIFVFR